MGCFSCFSSAKSKRRHRASSAASPHSQGSGTKSANHQAQSTGPFKEEKHPRGPLTSFLNRVSSIVTGNATIDDDFASCRDDFSVDGESTASREQSGCLSKLSDILSSEKQAPLQKESRNAGQLRAVQLLASSKKPDAGCSLSRRSMSASASNAKASYEEIDGTWLKIRSLNYMKTKVKEPSSPAIYRMHAADIFTFGSKQDHIASLVNLPPSQRQHRLSPGSPRFFPHHLIVTIQLPNYNPHLFGGPTDGQGCSICFYFKLPEDFNPETFPNQKALGLLRRFVENGKEADGSPTRDRVKTIARIVNVDEWRTKGPLSLSEFKLLSNYNEKPVLTRPQQTYYEGPDDSYLEVDLDLHSYSYLARSALMSFMERLNKAVWEIAFVIQGNGIEELPEQVLACVRMFRTEFSHAKPFQSYQTAEDK